MNREQDNVQWIPIDKITIPNPRSRGEKKFKQIIANIAEIGLKKPITVSDPSSTVWLEPKWVRGQKPRCFWGSPCCRRRIMVPQIFVMT